jgi:hypothetical protein
MIFSARWDIIYLRAAHGSTAALSFFSFAAAYVILKYPLNVHLRVRVKCLAEVSPSPVGEAMVKDV